MRAAVFHPCSVRITATVLCFLLLDVFSTAEQGLSNWRQGDALAAGSAAAGAVQVLHLPQSIANVSCIQQHTAAHTHTLFRALAGSGCYFPSV